MTMPCPITRSGSFNATSAETTMRRSVLAFLAILSLAGCAAEPLGPPDTATESAINLTAFAAGTSIATLVVEVSAQDIPTPLIFNLLVDEATGVASGTVRVPHGEDRSFTLTAFDANGEITHEGQATIDVRPGQNPPLQIALGPRSGHVPVTVSFGAYTVIVSPGSASLELGTNGSIQLSVQMLDENGQGVADLATVQWATNAPAVASVDASGLVTGLMPGAASIVATYEGVAGVAIVTVSAGGAMDQDGDGFTSDVDCDDSRNEVYPGALEVPDGLDNDCDELIDES
jgi:hypothetical protein